MTDLDAAGAHKGEVIRPSFGFHIIDQPRNAFQPRGRHLLGARQAKIDAMQVNRGVLRHQVQAPPLRAVRREIIVGHHFQDIDAVERLEDAGCQFRPPAEADAILVCACPFSQNRSPLLRDMP
jgi:hypothetical protein